jgi:hypothetical protein
MMENKLYIRTAGALFILAMVCYMAGDALLASPHSKISITMGGLLQIANSLSVIAIAALLYPTLATQSKAGAAAYLALRITEGILLLAGTVFLLLPHDIMLSSAIDTEIFTIIATKLNYLMYQSGMIALGFGGIICCSILFKAVLLPRWLSLWGIIGYALLVLGSVAELIGYPYGIALATPGGLFELVSGTWMLLRGFRNPKNQVTPS